MREGDYEFGIAHARHLASYRRGEVEVYCINRSCDHFGDPTVVTYEEEYGQGWTDPEECPYCHGEWSYDQPDDDE